MPSRKDTRKDLYNYRKGVREAIGQSASKLWAIPQAENNLNHAKISPPARRSMTISSIVLKILHISHCSLSHPGESRSVSFNRTEPTKPDWNMAAPAIGMPFVNSTSMNKADPVMRKLIRSHCMLGKNRGKILHSRRKPKRDVHLEAASAVPDKLGSELSLLQFADSVDPSTLWEVLKCE